MKPKRMGKAGRTLLILAGAPDPPAHSCACTCCHNRISSQPLPSTALVLRLFWRPNPTRSLWGEERRGRLGLTPFLDSPALFKAWRQHAKRKESLPCWRFQRWQQRTAHTRSARWFSSQSNCRLLLFVSFWKSLLILQHQMNAKSMLAPSVRVCVLSVEVSTLPYIKLLCSTFNLNEHHYCTSSMMSPFSACTWAMAPKSRIMLNISYICQERRGCPVSDKLWSLLWSAKLLLLHLGCLYYLGISALKFVFISHKNQEGVHTLKKENDTCIYYHSPERSTLVRAEQGCSTRVLCAGRGEAESKPRLSTETALVRAEPHVLGVMRDNTLLCLDIPEQKKNTSSISDFRYSVTRP